MKYLFLVRASIQEGLGHLIRSSAVASRLPRKDEALFVIIGSDFAIPEKAPAAIRRTVVKTDAQALRYFERFRPDVSVLDLNDLEEGVFEKISGKSFTVSLSPLFAHNSDAALFFSRTRFISNDSGQFLPPLPGHYRCGLDYAIISSHCEKISSRQYEKNIQKGPLSLAISMGGSDCYNKTREVIQAVNELPFDLVLWVLVGAGYPHSYQTLVEAVTHYDRHEIILAKTNRSMWHILQHCALAILAGGTTTYEAAYAGLPSINLLADEKDYFLVRELVERGAAVYGGVFHAGNLKKLSRDLIELNHNRDLLLKMHRAAGILIDGLGAKRILREIERCYRQANKREVKVYSSPLMGEARRGRISFPL